MYQYDDSLWGKISRWLLEKKLFWPAMVILALLSLVLFGPFGILTAISIGVVMFQYFRIKIQETIRAQKQQRQFLEQQKQEEAKALEQRRKFLEEQERYISIADKILKFMEDNTPPCDDDAMGTHLKFNDMVKELGIGTEFVYRIYQDVYKFLATVTTEEYARKFAAKMFLFYKELAHDYDYCTYYGPRVVLLCYLRWCFRNDKNPRDGDGSPQFYTYLFPGHRLYHWDYEYLELLEEACASDFSYAKELLANCYYNNELVDQRDYERAFKLYREAAQDKEEESMYMVGECYEKGRGVKVNFQKAGDCYQYAYEYCGDSRCAAAVDRLYTAGKWDKTKYNPDIFCTVKEMKKENLDELSAAVAKWERTDLAEADCETAAGALRRILEKVVNSFVEFYEEDCMKDTLNEKCKLLSRKGYFTKEIDWKARKVRQLGNRGAHDDNGRAITESELQECIQNIRDIVEYYRQY